MMWKNLIYIKGNKKKPDPCFMYTHTHTHFKWITVQNVKAATITFNKKTQENLHIHGYLRNKKH